MYVHVGVHTFSCVCEHAVYMVHLNPLVGIFWKESRRCVLTDFGLMFSSRNLQLSAEGFCHWLCMPYPVKEVKDFMAHLLTAILLWMAIIGVECSLLNDLENADGMCSG